MAEGRPLVVDVDGTFLRTGLGAETLWAALGRAPLAVLRAVARHGARPLALAQALDPVAPLRLDLLPVNPDVARLAAEARAQGRAVILAAASQAGTVSALARQHDLSPGILAGTPARPLTGEARAQALALRHGAGGYDYVGGHRDDLPAWRQAGTAVIVGGGSRLASQVQDTGATVQRLSGGWSARDLLRALRPHQWVKNILLLLPMIAAHRFDLPTLLAVLAGILAFSAAASAIYLVNDLLDLEADRLHPTKRRRPFASGAVPLGVGTLAAGGLALAALAVALALGPAVLAVVVVYMVLSLAYSLRLKRLRWVDVFTLAALYTLRVVAGAAASRVDASIYMLIFIFPVFLTLGCVKRMTELALAEDDAPLPGRGYGRRDRGDLLNMAGLGIAGALTIFALYSVSDQGRALYPTTWILWLTLIPITAWLVRMVALGFYGKQDYDPIVFALRDRIGLGILMLILSLMFWAAGLWAQWFG